MLGWGVRCGGVWDLWLFGWGRGHRTSNPSVDVLSSVWSVGDTSGSFIYLVQRSKLCHFHVQSLKNYCARCDVKTANFNGFYWNFCFYDEPSQEEKLWFSKCHANKYFVRYAFVFSQPDLILWWTTVFWGTVIFIKLQYVFWWGLFAWLKVLFENKVLKASIKHTFH